MSRDEDLVYLRGMFPIGSTVHTVLRHVSQSGLTRAISVVRVENGQVYDASYLVARALGMKLDLNWSGIKVGGVGMDMGYHLVYSLSRALYADGFPCTGHDHGEKRCPSNDHFNESTPNYVESRIHSDPGYALKHRWI